MHTSEILRNEEKMKRIQEIGKSCTDSLLKDPTIPHFFKLCWYFTKETGLASQKILQALKDANKHGYASMCMLGNTVFATGDIQLLSKSLEKYGQIFVTKSDMQGVRIID
jgi:pantoate kinase